MFLIFWDELAGEFWQGNGGTDLCTPFPCPNSSANVGLRFFVLMGLGLPSELSFFCRGRWRRGNPLGSSRDKSTSVELDPLRARWPATSPLDSQWHFHGFPRRPTPRTFPRKKESIESMNREKCEIRELEQENRIPDWVRSPVRVFRVVRGTPCGIGLLFPTCFHSSGNEGNRR